MGKCISSNKGGSIVELLYNKHFTSHLKDSYNDDSLERIYKLFEFSSHESFFHIRSLITVNGNETKLNALNYFYENFKIWMQSKTTHSYFYKYPNDTLMLKEYLTSQFTYIYNKINESLPKDLFTSCNISVTTIVVVDKIIISIQLGNNSAFILQKMLTSKKKSILELTTKHTVKNINEVKRITNIFPYKVQTINDNSYSLVYPYLSKCFNENHLITRCFGDFKSASYGIITTPDVCITDNSISNRIVFLTNFYFEEVINPLKVFMVLYNYYKQEEKEEILIVKEDKEKLPKDNIFDLLMNEATKALEKRKDKSLIKSPTIIKKNNSNTSPLISSVRDKSALLDIKLICYAIVFNEEPIV